MATLADSLVSSASRALALRKRPDLTVRRQRYHGRVYWVVKEPVGLNYYRFHEEEYAILCMLDGHTSLEEIKTAFEEEFTPQKITFQDLQQFVGMLHRSGLVIASSSGQGRQLRRRRDEKKRKELLGKFTNIFAFRWRGIDPDRILNRLYPFVRWVYAPVAVFCCVALMLSAASLVLVNFETFQSRLPAFHEFFGPKNWIYLAISMGLVKIIHEFGHGLTCKHYGGECHEMGFMLLVFTPALYCNVSDSWMLPNKWHRVAIGAAGMYVEGVIASAATFIWWYSNPGLMNYICLSLMFICSVSTLLFNGNPLLRFDGYYILMDIVEIPNLRQKSTEVLRRFMIDLCLGIEQPENPFLPQENRFFFGLYTVAAVIYRWVVVFSILMFLNAVLEPYGLKVIGRLIGALGFMGLVIQPLYQLGKFFYMPGRMHKVKKPRLIASVAVVVCLIVFIVWVPLPFHVTASFDLQPKDVKAVYADVPGILQKMEVSPGSLVEQHQPLALLENEDLQLAIIELQGRQADVEQQLETLRRQRLANPDVGLQIPQVLAVLNSIEEQLAEKEQQLGHLQIKAPASGTVIPPPRKSNRPTGDGRLPTWTGSAFDEKNLGAYITESDLICRIGDPQVMEAVLVIDQNDIDLVDGAMPKRSEAEDDSDSDSDSDASQAQGPEIRLMLDALPGQVFTTHLKKVAQVDLKYSPPSLSSQAGGNLDTRTDASGMPVPLSTSYQASADLDNSQRMFRTGMRGKAKIYTGWQPLGRRFYRLVVRTFAFNL